MKPYYTDYADHCIKVRLKFPVKPTDTIEKRNWMCAETILRTYAENEMELVSRVYDGDMRNINVKIGKIAEDEGITFADLRKMISHLQCEVARERGLIE